MSDSKKLAALAQEIEKMANAGHRTGYRPDIHYTKLMPNGQVHYFDQGGKHTGTGTLHDKVHFKWIPDEHSRKEPDQEVNPERFHQMVLDTEPLYVNIPAGHTKTKGKPEKPKAEPPKTEPKPEDKPEVEATETDGKADGKPEPRIDMPKSGPAAAKPTVPATSSAPKPVPPAPTSKPADPTAKPEAEPEDKKDDKDDGKKDEEPKDDKSDKDDKKDDDKSDKPWEKKESSFTSQLKALIKAKK